MLDYYTLKEIKERFPLDRKNGYSYFVDEITGIEKIQLYNYRKLHFIPGKYYLSCSSNIATYFQDHNGEFKYGQTGIWLGHKWGHFKTLKEAVDFLSKCLKEREQDYKTRKV